MGAGVKRAKIAGFALAMLVTAVGAPSAHAATERMSIASSGEQGNDHSDGNTWGSAVSADGRFVVFNSAASNLVVGDTNAYWDLFLRDRRMGTTERISVGTEGDEIGATGRPAISADGRFVVFPSPRGLLLRDRSSGTTESAATTSVGLTVDGQAPAISADGRFIAFSAFASSVVAGDTNGGTDVFVVDRQTGEIERVSVPYAGGQAAQGGAGAAISADGRYVAFESRSPDLVAGDTNGTWDVFVYDRQADTIARASVEAPGAGSGNASGSNDPAISADGRFVAFASAEANLVPADTNRQGDAFVRDLWNGTTERVSVTSAETQANRDSKYPAISADGRYVYFQSMATNISSSGGFMGLFRRDRTDGVTKMVSRNSGGVPANGHSYIGGTGSITADGQSIVFSSDATNLVAADTNARRDVFLTRGVTEPPPVCEGQPATIVGTTGPDTLTGTAGRDVIVGLGGADTITGGQGDDVVCGDGGATSADAEGADVLDGGSGNDVLAGGGGADRIWGTGGTDRLLGGWGKDLLGGGSEDDSLAGGSGDDTLDGAGGADVMDGGDGRDLADYSKRTMPVTASLGDGPADGEAAEGDDVGADVEKLRGGTAGDRLIGDEAANWLYGGDGGDTLTGAGGSDTLSGEAGADTIDSRDEVKDSVYCGSDLDTVFFDVFDAVSASCEIRSPA